MSTRRFLPVVLLGFALVSLGLPSRSLGRTRRYAAAERYINKAKGFSIRFPEGWRRKENVMGVNVLALSPLDGPGDRFAENINLVVEALPKPISLEEAARSAQAATQRLMAGYKKVGEGSLSIRGSEAKWWGFEHRAGAAGLSFRAQQFLFVKGKRAYTLTCTATPETFARYKSLFEQSVRTFRFEGEAP